MKTLILLVLMALSGCATIQDHPYAASFAVALVAGSIIASTHHDDQRGAAISPEMAHIAAPSCAGGACR
jgi:uncharacterized protein YceK